MSSRQGLLLDMVSPYENRRGLLFALDSPDEQSAGSIAGSGFPGWKSKKNCCRFLFSYCYRHYLDSMHFYKYAKHMCLIL